MVGWRSAYRGSGRLCLALRELGKLPAEQVVAPALRLARMAFQWADIWRVARQPRCRSYGQDIRCALCWPPGGRRLPWVSSGVVLSWPRRSPSLAARAFVFLPPGSGAIGDEILRAATAEGRVDGRRPAGLQAAVASAAIESYRGWRIITAPPPAGGMTALETLQILDARPPLSAGPGSSATLHEIVESFKHAFADRARYHGDPAFDKIPPELGNPAYAAERASTIQPDRIPPAAQYGRPQGNTPAQAPRDHGTTHLCVIDKDGNAAALTTTVNLSFGAHVIAGRTGVLLNNQMDDFAAATGKPMPSGWSGRAPTASLPASVQHRA